MNTNHPTTKFISSHQTEDSGMHKRIFSLGKMLVEQFELTAETDTLTKWMAHYIAEQMMFAEQAIGEEKKKAEEQCFETILKVWNHHASYPTDVRPFGNFEPIFRVLERLDPDNSSQYLYSHLYDRSKEKSEFDQSWLNIALDINTAVKVILNYIFYQATASAVDESNISWLENTENLPSLSHLEVLNRIFTNYQSTISEESIIKKRIEYLDKLVESGKRLREIFINDLENISNSNPEPNGFSQDTTISNDHR